MGAQGLRRTARTAPSRREVLDQGLGTAEWAGIAAVVAANAASLATQR
ncbi:hypothetical protein [Streptomyces reticuli]